MKDFDDLSLEKRNLLVFSVHKVWQEAFSVYDIVEEIVYEIRSAGYKCVNYFSFPVAFGIPAMRTNQTI